MAVFARRSDGANHVHRRTVTVYLNAPSIIGFSSHHTATPTRRALAAAGGTGPRHLHLCRLVYTVCHSRKPLFTGNGTYSSDVSDDVSHVLTNFVTKL
jgi:hypothetical protein